MKVCVAFGDICVPSLIVQLPYRTVVESLRYAAIMQVPLQLNVDALDRDIKNSASVFGVDCQ